MSRRNGSCRFFIPHSRPIPLRWNLSDMRAHFRNAWRRITCWPTYIAQLFLSPYFSVRSKNPVRQIEVFRSDKINCLWLDPVTPTSLDQALSAGICKDTYDQLLDLKTRSREKAFEYIENLYDRLGDLGVVEFSAIIQGLEDLRVLDLSTILKGLHPDKGKHLDRNDSAQALSRETTREVLVIDHFFRI